MKTELLDFKEYPTCFVNQKGNKCHESILRHFHIAAHLMRMVERGDSKETIAEVFTLLKNLPEPPAQ